MKKFKKLISIMLTVVMALAMSMTAFASESSKGDYKLTIKTKTNHIYSVYQLATGDVSSTGEELANISVGANAKADVKVAEIKGLVGKSGTELGDAALELVNTDSKPAATITGTGEDVSVSLPGGYYVITDKYITPPADEDVNITDSLSRTMVTLVKDTTMTPKDTTVTPDKKILEGEGENEKELDANEASIGDTIRYRLSGVVPDMQDFKTFKYVFVDTMSKGLTPDVKVGDVLPGKVGTNDKAEFEVTGLTKDTSGNTTIRIALRNAFDLCSNAGKGATVSVEITATLNENAIVTPGTATEKNENKEKIEWSNNPSHTYDGDPDFQPDEPKGVTPDVTVETFTTELTITKNDGNGNTLRGAEFELTSTNSAKVGYVTGQEYVPYSSAQNYTGGKWYKLVDGAYTETAPTADTANKYADEEEYALVDINKTNYDSTATSLKAFVNSAGKVTFTGLGVGDYKLVETTTPDGYNTIGDITFKVTWTKADGFRVSDVTGGATISVAGVENNGTGVGTILSTTIINEKGSLLPSTGGIGTTIFYIIGGILVIGAGIILVVKKRASHE